MSAREEQFRALKAAAEKATEDLFARCIGHVSADLDHAHAACMTALDVKEDIADLAYAYAWLSVGHIALTEYFKRAKQERALARYKQALADLRRADAKPPDGIVAAAQRRARTRRQEVLGFEDERTPGGDRS